MLSIELKVDFYSKGQSLLSILRKNRVSKFFNKVKIKSNIFQNGISARIQFIINKTYILLKKWKINFNWIKAWVFAWVDHNFC